MTGSCNAGQKVVGIEANGDVMCAADVDTNSTYGAGAGLSLSGGTFSISAGGVGATQLAANSINANHINNNAVGSSEIVDGSVGAEDIDASTVQRRVGSSCPAGQSIRAIATDGTVTCEPDDVGGSGDITGVTTSSNSGLSGGCNSGTCSLGIDLSDFMVAPVYLYDAASATIDAPYTVGEEVMEASITVPRSGSLVARAMGSWECALSLNSAAVIHALQTSNSGTPNNNASATHSGAVGIGIVSGMPGSTSAARQQNSIQGVFPVAAGTHTIYWRAGLLSGANSCTVNSRSMSLSFVPY